MGSSDPLPAGFEIQFGSLNFQATGTTTSCASPTAMSFTRGGRPGQDRSPSHPLLTPRRPPERTLRALQHLNADDAPVSAPVSAPDRRRRNNDGPRASPHNATRSLTRWQLLQQGGVQFPGRGSPSVCAVP
jgi:hypothetical protein